MSIFDFTESTFDKQTRQVIGELLVDFHDMFTRHRFDSYINTDFKEKLTPSNESPAYRQNLPTPITLKENIKVELAFLHINGSITTLPFSKNASPIFARGKPNAKLRLVVALRKINKLTSGKHKNNNHSVSTSTDAAQQKPEKKLFCKLDCSLAYQEANQQSVEILAFGFASRTFAYRTLEQGVGRSLSAFSSLMRDYLDPVIKADQCSQNVDNIHITATSPEQLITNLRAVFQCIQNAVLKLLMARSHYETKDFGFLGRTVKPKSVNPEKQKITKLLDKVKIPSSKESLQQYIGFLK